MLGDKHHIHKVINATYTNKACLNDQKSTSKKDAFNNFHRIVQHKLDVMRDTWFRNQADELQRFADNHDIKKRTSTLLFWQSTVQHYLNHCPS